MTTPTHDLIAICYDAPDDYYVAEFRREALAAGHRVERVTTKEACERHLEYLRGFPVGHPWRVPAPTTMQEDAP